MTHPTTLCKNKKEATNRIQTVITLSLLGQLGLVNQVVFFRHVDGQSYERYRSDETVQL